MGDNTAQEQGEPLGRKRVCGVLYRVKGKNERRIRHGSSPPDTANHPHR
jgi:hypothetical protein